MALVEMDFASGGSIENIKIFGMYDSTRTNVSLSEEINHIDIAPLNLSWNQFTNLESIIVASVNKGQLASGTINGKTCTIELASDGMSFSFTVSSGTANTMMLMY